MAENEQPLGTTPDLGQYRELLRTYVERISRKYQAKFDESDIVQETLADAQKHLGAFRGQSEAELTSWLRKMLTRNMIDAVRRLRSRKRDVANELRIQRTKALTGRSTNMWLRAEQTSPSGRVACNEQLQQMQIAIEALPEAQRLAIQLHHLQGMTLAQVALQLNRSPAAVAGLLHRGLCALQKSVSE